GKLGELATIAPPTPPPKPPEPGADRIRSDALGVCGWPLSPERSRVPAIVTSPCANHITGQFKVLLVSFNVTPAPMFMVVKLNIQSPAGLRGGLKVLGSNIIVPGVVRFNAPSEPFEPLLKVP